jgi:hypothetical protein
MKNVFSFVAALLLLLTTGAHAQDPTLSTLPGDPSATLIARMPLATEVTIDVLGKKKGERIANEIMVWRTSAGGTELTVNTPSIAPTTGEAIDVLPTQEIYRQIAKAGVAEAALRGYFPGDGAHATKVWLESNVSRTGTGLNTRFAACSTYTPVSHQYAVSISNGSVTVTEVMIASAPNPCSSTSGSIQ